MVSALNTRRHESYKRLDVSFLVGKFQVGKLTGRGERSSEWEVSVWHCQSNARSGSHTKVKKESGTHTTGVGIGAPGSNTPYSLYSHSYKTLSFIYSFCQFTLPLNLKHYSKMPSLKQLIFSIIF